MEKWIIDRIEEDYIILENNENIKNIKKREIKFSIKEGDVLIKNKDGKYILDKDATVERKDYIEDLTKDLWEN